MRRILALKSIIRALGCGSVMALTAFPQGQTKTAPAESKKTAATTATSAFVRMPKDIQCTIQGMSFTSTVGKSGELVNTGGSVEGLTCKIAGAAPAQEKEVPLAATEISNGMLPTKGFRKFKITPVNNINSAAVGISIRRDKLPAFRKFLQDAAPPDSSNASSQIAPPQAEATNAQTFALLHCDEIVGTKLRLSMILVSSKPEAEEIVQKLKEGQSFSDLARKYSIDDNTKDSGGAVGLVSLTDLRDEFRAALTGIHAGETTRIVVRGSSAKTKADRSAPQTVLEGKLFLARGVTVDGIGTESLWVKEGDAQYEIKLAERALLPVAWHQKKGKDSEYEVTLLGVPQYVEIENLSKNADGSTHIKFHMAAADHEGHVKILLPCIGRYAVKGQITLPPHGNWAGQLTANEIGYLGN